MNSGMQVHLADKSHVTLLQKEKTIKMNSKNDRIVEH